MENKKINIAELLRNCPHGMELDSPAYNNLYFDNIIDSDSYPIKCYTTYNGMLNTVFLTKYGEIRREENAKCVIFPKGKTTWEGFVPPCKFKDGDIVYFMCNCGDEYTAIFKKMGNKYLYTYIDFNCGSFTGISESLFEIEYIKEVRLATKEEKRNFFDVIKENGYHWNAETKTLEYLFETKFKVGDVVQDKDGYKVEITEVNIGDECYVYLSKLLNWKGSISFNDQDKWELVPDKIEPKFKVGDRVKHKQSFISGTITNIDDDCYKIKYDSGAVSFANIKYQDDWKLVSDEIEPKFNVGDKIRLKGNLIYTITGIRENKSGCGVTFDLRFSEQDKKRELVPDKFDISTLKPFESRVLVRHTKDEIWKPAIFGCYNGYRYYVLGNVHWVYCIPYEGNEHLCGKIDDCDEYYKTWEL